MTILKNCSDQASAWPNIFLNILDNLVKGHFI